MAELLDIEQTTYSNWETGKVDLTLKNITRIAQVLKLPERDLWDPGQFENRYGLPEESNSLAEEPRQKYGFKGKTTTMMPVSDCDEVVNGLQAEIKKLKDENWALSQSLLRLFAKGPDQI